eukprot:1176769-Prorocentrum_minimum.AAC.6
MSSSDKRREVDADVFGELEFSSPSEISMFRSASELVARLGSFQGGRGTYRERFMTGSSHENSRGSVTSRQSRGSVWEGVANYSGGETSEDILLEPPFKMDTVGDTYIVVQVRGPRRRVVLRGLEGILRGSRGSRGGLTSLSLSQIAPPSRRGSSGWMSPARCTTLLV